MANNDYILRSDAVSAFCGNCEATEVCGQLGEPCEEVKRIEAIPAADVEPKRKTGVWIRCGEPDGDRNIRFECSVCHAGDVHAEGMNVPYCWKCGAKLSELK